MKLLFTHFMPYQRRTKMNPRIFSSNRKAGQVMSFEGNYLDGLMSRKESIYNLLRAKYYLNCIIVFIPFLIMMIPVAKGKIPFLMALSYMLFTAGFVFAMMLQLAVYNKKTLPLNANVMRSNRGSSLFQTIIISCAFFLPLIINKALTAFFEQDTACIIMMIIGYQWIHSLSSWPEGNRQLQAALQ